MAQAGASSLRRLPPRVAAAVQRGEGAVEVGAAVPEHAPPALASSGGRAVSRNQQRIAAPHPHPFPSSQLHLQRTPRGSAGTRPGQKWRSQSPAPAAAPGRCRRWPAARVRPPAGRTPRIGTPASGTCVPTAARWRMSPSAPPIHRPCPAHLRHDISRGPRHKAAAVKGDVRGLKPLRADAVAGHHGHLHEQCQAVRGRRSRSGDKAAKQAASPVCPLHSCHTRTMLAPAWPCITRAQWGYEE